MDYQKEYWLLKEKADNQTFMLKGFAKEAVSRDEKINSLNLNVDNLHKIIKNKDERIGILKAWYTKALFVASVTGLIFSLCYIGISSSASL